MRNKLASLLILFYSVSLFAREGMWLPLLLHQNIDEMQQMGFALSAEEVYSINQSSLKDAVVLFGRGCTGVLISPDGLLATNHHCGYGQIQNHSTIENNYLTNGFWAMDRANELPNNDLSVVFLVEMRNVTDLVLAGTDSLLSDNNIAKKRDENIADIIKEATNGNHYEATVKPLFNGNQYYLYINERFTDIRLVGSPPSSIGKFGGDTDNWMWPRHTGDFSLFRIYSDSLNRPAPYSKKNVPYQPKKFLTINIKGIENGSFTMVYGYPGATYQYLNSNAVKQIIEQRNPDRVAIRERKMEIISNAMSESPETRIKYAVKYASTSNSWKKWKGEIVGLKRLNAVGKKISEEVAFSKWVNENGDRKYLYGTVLKEFEKLYSDFGKYQMAKDYFDEIVLRGSEAYIVYGIAKSLPNEIKKPRINSDSKRLLDFFKDFDPNVDKQLFADLMLFYHSNVPTELQHLKLVKAMKKGSALKKLEKAHQSTILFKQAELLELIENGEIKKLKKIMKRDKLCIFYDQLMESYHSLIFPSFNNYSKLLEINQKIYVEALLEMNHNKALYPDANLTLRYSFGKVEGYAPSDGVKYGYFTTLDGIIEKDDPNIYDYNVPDKLKELWNEKDFGRYATKTGELPVCFSASNHTTGGNSGSPILDKNGYLIGLNFDRGWEGITSDILYDPEMSRNISLDIRYMLFVIDKYAGAEHLINEMNIVDYE